MILDAHVHVTETGCFLRQDGSVRDASLKTLLKEMDEHGIDQAVLLPIGRMPNYRGQAISNAYVASVVRDYPGRFRAFGSMDSLEPDSLDRFKADVNSYGLLGFKLHPILQAIDPADKRLWSLYEFCMARKLPVVIHTGTIRTVCPEARYASPCCVEPVLHSFPGLAVILAHMGCGSAPPDYHAEALRMAENYGHVYLGISYSTREQLLLSLERIGAARLIFESDFPYWTIAQAVRLVKDLPDGPERRGILYDNMTNLLAESWS